MILIFDALQLWKDTEGHIIAIIGLYYLSLLVDFTDRK